LRDTSESYAGGVPNATSGGNACASILCVLVAGALDPRLLMMPCAYAQSTTLSNIAGGYALAPVSSFRNRASNAEIDRVVEQVVDRVLEGAGQQLLRQVDRQEPRAGVDILVTSHRGDAVEEISAAASSTAVVPALVPQVPALHCTDGVFLQPR
jgi:hypothetical protein